MTVYDRDTLMIDGEPAPKTASADAVEPRLIRLPRAPHRTSPAPDPREPRNGSWRIAASAAPATTDRDELPTDRSDPRGPYVFPVMPGKVGPPEPVPTPNCAQKSASAEAELGDTKRRLKHLAEAEGRQRLRPKGRGGEGGNRRPLSLCVKRLRNPDGTEASDYYAPFP